MKILHINPYPPENLGGSELFCKNLAISLAKKKNISCDILTSDFLKRNVKINYLENNVKVIYKKFFFSIWDKNPVVNIFNFLRKYHTNYDLIHAHAYPFFSSIQAALMKKILKYPFILHLHGFEIQQNLIPGFNFYEKLQLKFKRLIFDKYIGKIPIKWADAVISVTDRDLKKVQNMFKLDKKKCFFIPNGIDTCKFRPDKTSHRKYITFIGRLSYIKGIDIFLNLIKEIYKLDRNLKFLIIGDGPLRNMVLTEMKELPIRYYPFYPYESIQKIYNLSKLVLITSRFEGLPTILLESFASETPVISTNVGGIGEVIKHGKNGYLISLKNFNRAPELILELINNQDKMNNFGRNGRNLIEQNFSWKTVTDQIIKVYQLIFEKSSKIKKIS